ncbi:hypothetical protein MYCTH_2069908, partial [Thermothelomyces thermophilus ATCC 42464]
AVVMIKEQVIDIAPVTTRYSTFTGGFGMIVGGVGAILGDCRLRPGSCPDRVGRHARQRAAQHGLLNRGSESFDDGEKGHGVVRPPGNDHAAVERRLRGNCRRAQADEALQFLCFGMAAGLVAIGYLQMRRAGPGRGRTGAYVA